MPEAAVDAPNPPTASPGNQGGTTLPEQELSYEDVMEEGAALAMEEVQDRLDDAGLEMDPETMEIIGGEAAFDPRARRRKGTRRRTTSKRKGTRRRGRIAMARHPALVYDPRSRFGKARGYARRAKDPISKMLTKAAPFASIGGAGLAFYLKYKKRAVALGVPGVMDAITLDIKNLDFKAATDRIIANAGEIATPAIVGYVLKQVPIGPAKIRQLLGNGMMGASGGILAGHFLDPPIPGQEQVQNQGGFPMNSGAGIGRAPQSSGVPTYGGL